MMTGTRGGGGGNRGSALQAFLAARGGREGPRTLSEINVTPFVDVVLVLLIIFMITAPLLVRAMDVSLPAAGLRQQEATERLVVTVDHQGRTFIGDRAVNIALLEQRLKEAVELRGVRVAYLRADEELRYRQIIAIMDLMKRAGIDTIGLVYVYPEEKISR
ncbi:MAG: ExbD/TolR family protein [Acidobacteriota bacterium]